MPGMAATSPAQYDSSQKLGARKAPKGSSIPLQYLFVRFRNRLSLRRHRCRHEPVHCFGYLRTLSHFKVQLPASPRKNRDLNTGPIPTLTTLAHRPSTTDPLHEHRRRDAKTLGKSLDLSRV